MKRASIICFTIALLLLVWLVYANAATFYVDSTSGANCDGTTTATTDSGDHHCAWPTIAKVNAASFSAGDSVLFNRGQTWREQLTVPSSGSAGSPITFGAYGSGALPIINGANVISGTWTLVSASASVAFQGIKLSTANGTAFVDFNTAGSLTNYASMQLTITDSSGKHLVGYIKSAGTGETYGPNILTNPSFDSDVTGWSSSGTIADVSGGYVNNCLQLTSTEDQYFYQSVSGLTSGALYKGSAWMKRGTLTSRILINFFLFGGTYLSLGYDSGSWQQFTLYCNATGTGGNYGYGLYVGGNGTTLFDEASLNQVLTPSSTGVTITSTASGSTYNWTSMDSGFNTKDTGGYTYSISGTSSNTYQIALANNPGLIVMQNGSPLSYQTSIGAVISIAGSYYWDGTYLYVHATDNSNPNTNGYFYESPGRDFGVLVNGKNYVAVQNLQVQYTGMGTGGVDVLESAGIMFNGGAGNGIVQNCVAIYNNIGGIAGGYVGGMPSHLTFTYNTAAYNLGVRGIGGGFSGEDNYVTYNTSHDNGNAIAASLNHGFYIDGALNAVIYVRYNKAYNNIYGAGYSSAYETASGTFTTYWEYNLSWNNLEGFFAHGGSGAAAAQQDYLYNLTDYGSTYGVRVGYAGDAGFPTIPSIKNCIFSNNTTNGVIVAGGGITNFTNNNVYGAGPENYNGIADPTGNDGNISANPLFINASGSYSQPTDFKLQSGSPAIGAGTDVGLTTDFCGNWIPTGHVSIGAVQYQPKMMGY